ncbi:MAG: hypothetical protein CFE26_19465 [Verrucomicrobiales bacterium VVV1]|nr:MAG: hypothetical protein CFE26_19465 [Verrucomicrobiales bacterium VVV1]
MNLFRQKLAIFIILSWVMLIAAVVGCFAGWVGTALLLLFPFILLRVLAAGGKMFTKIARDDSGKVDQSTENRDVEKQWGRNEPLGLFSLERFLVFSCVFLLFGMIPLEVALLRISEFFEVNQRNPRLILGILAGVLALIHWDVRVLIRNAAL